MPICTHARMNLCTYTCLLQKMNINKSKHKSSNPEPVAFEARLENIRNFRERRMINLQKCANASPTSV